MRPSQAARIVSRPAAKLTWRYCGSVPSSCNRGLMPSDPLRRAGMEQYVGLDVSQERTSVCVVDGGGKVIWEGQCTSTPEAIAATLRTRAPEAVRIGLESGPLSAWHWHELRKLGLPVVCLDARHVKAALALQLNKSDRTACPGVGRGCSRPGADRTHRLVPGGEGQGRGQPPGPRPAHHPRAAGAHARRPRQPDPRRPQALWSDRRQGWWAALRRAGAGAGRGRAAAGGGWGAAGGLAGHRRANRGARPPARGRGPAGRGGAAADDRTRCRRSSNIMPAISLVRRLSVTAFIPVVGKRSLLRGAIVVATKSL